jgi:hypothetical protein
VWHCHPEVICGCRPMPVPGSGWINWKKYKNIVKNSSKFLIFCFLLRNNYLCSSKKKKE